MAKSQFEKTFKNVSTTYSSTPQRSRRYGNQRESFTFKFTPTSADKNRLKSYMDQELYYYNSLVEGLGARFRTNPQFLLEIKDDYEALFGEIAYTGYDVAAIQFNTDVELPESLRKFEKYLLGRDSDGKRYLTEQLYTLYKLAGGNGSILRNTRKGMALAMLQFYKKQSGTRLRSTKMVNQEFSEPLSVLETCDNIRKRHVQIQKKDVKYRWDEANEQSVLETPYTSKIIIPHWNITQHNTWNMIMIHQEPGSMPRTDTPWVVDLRTNLEGYMLAYLDVKSPYGSSAFNIAKRR